MADEPLPPITIDGVDDEDEKPDLVRRTDAFNGMSEAEQRKKLAAMLRECAPVDNATTAFKASIGYLEKTDWPRKLIWMNLQAMVDAYAAGYEFPLQSSAHLVQADDAGVDRDTLVRAAHDAGKTNGETHEKRKNNMRTMLSTTRKQLRAMKEPPKIPTEDIVEMAVLHELAGMFPRKR